MTTQAPATAAPSPAPKNTPPEPGTVWLSGLMRGWVRILGPYQELSEDEPTHPGLIRVRVISGPDIGTVCALDWRRLRSGQPRPKRQGISSRG